MLPIIEVTAKTCYTLTVYIPAIPIRNFQRSYIMKLFSDIAEKITNKWEDIKLRVYSRQVIPKSKSYWGLAAAEILLMIPFTYKMQVSIFFALTNGGLPLTVIGAILAIISTVIYHLFGAKDDFAGIAIAAAVGVAVSIIWDIAVVVFYLGFMLAAGLFILVFGSIIFIINSFINLF